MDNELVNDLSSDLAIAVIVEKKLSHKIDPREAVTLVKKVTSELLLQTERSARFDRRTELGNSAFVH